MAFLNNISSAGNNVLNAVNNNFTPGETTPRNLSSVDPSDPDKVNNFGTLGDFASKIDNTALRSYVETGLIRNIRPQNLEILMQEPDCTVLIKKRMFSSTADNYRFDLMPAEDKLFVRASKTLFKNKCQAISTYEQLSKFDRIVKNTGVINDAMIPQILSGVNTLSNLGVNIVNAKTKAVLDSLQSVMSLSQAAQTTTWNVKNKSAFYSEMGEGTGVFDLTLVANVNTTTSIEFGKGQANLTIEDPYNLMQITEADIEKALSDASSVFNSSNFFLQTQSISQDVINNLKSNLNNARFNRGASAINFIINDDSILYRRVRAIIDDIGQEIFFNYNPGVLGVGNTVDIDDTSLEGNNALTSSEQKTFTNIVKNIYSLLNLQNTTNNQLNNISDASHKQINYVREKMALNYQGKAIIQSMDVVHVFMSSKTNTDPKVIGYDAGNLSGGSLLSALNQTTNNIQNSWNNISGFFGGNIQNTTVEMEKEAIVGADFPTWLWLLVKNAFTRQTAGVQVFSGIVSHASTSYSSSNGKYELNVSVKDNTEYMNKGQINLKPSVDVYNSALYDPYTPFDLDFDASTGFSRGELPALLDENIKLLESGLIKFKNGALRGTTASESLYKIQNGERVPGSANLNYRTVLNDPDGFIYRWKSGIGSFTSFNRPSSTILDTPQTSPLLTKDPFAGQDVMNVLSLLITGQPYNYNTFVAAGLKVGSLTRDDILNQDGSVSYYRGLLSDLSKNNLTWGNFIPFKQQVVNERGLNYLVYQQSNLSTTNAQLNDLLQQRANFFDQLTLTPAGAIFANNPQQFAINQNYVPIPPSNNNTATAPNDPATIAAQNIVDINKQIVALQTDMQNRLSTPNLNNGALKIYGDDISYDSSISNDSSLTQDQKNRARNEFRRKLNFLTQRRLWKIKANEDINLFIVDDQYDKSYDIQAFEQGLAAKPPLFNSEYVNVGSQITRVSGELGLEVFADSQGHIRARPPAYNKVPSSVFYKMIRDAATKKKRIYPQLLESLFLNQADGAKDQIEIVEDQIRYRTALLGFADDPSSQRFIASSSGGYGGFLFVTGSDGFLGGAGLQNMFQQANPDVRSGIDYKPLKSIDQVVSGQLAQVAIFTIASKITAIQTPSIFTNYNNSSSLTRANAISARLKTKGVIVSNPIATQRITQNDVLSLVNEIAQFISERQGLLKTLSNSIKNLSDASAVNNDPKAARSILYPAINTKTTLPDILEHMIEDEETDDLGPGSGGRYIIHENQIMSLIIEEHEPEYTVIQVNGLFEEGLAPPPTAYDTGNGGNQASSAWAADYDLWRMYGFKLGQPVPAHSLSDPDSQLAPLAVYLLNRARKNILQGSCTITGNEYQQAGEVVYIESRNLLFYVESVQHSFSYSTGQFITKLELSFGHNPGEYIPTMLDIIGKSLYSSRHQANLVRHVRQGNAAGETPITTLITNNSADNSTLEGLVSGTFGEQNRKNLTNMVLAASGILTPNMGKNPVLELRIFYKGSVDSNLVGIAGEVADWVVNPTAQSLGGDLLPDANFSGGIGLDPSNIRVIPIDISNTQNPQSPSSQAWNLIRNVVGANTNIGFDPVNPDEKTQEETVLFHNIIDIWVTFEDIVDTVETSKNGAVANNQSAIQNNTTLTTALSNKS
jgi:hypothetical protein